MKRKNANGMCSEITSLENREAYSVTLNFNGQYAGLRGEFRATVTATVTRGGVTETAASSSYATY